MRPIGGFLPLEIPGGAGPWHSDAVALASGRACWHLILRRCRPRRVLLPFYICDAVLAPLEATGTPYEFYAVTEQFLPVLDSRPEAGELALVVNYFGVLTSFVEGLARTLAERVVIDDTQAFFHRGDGTRWSFNSARKFFGVPDGAYLYGPVGPVDGLPASLTGDCDHLLTRLAGDDGRAWAQFKDHEARFDVEPRAISPVSQRLLDGVDFNEARRRRQANFEVLHRALGPLNTLAMPLDDVAGGGPLCYPFLPETNVDREQLNREGVFVPVLWPEVGRRVCPGFDRERGVAERLLPLPIDHRYEPSDMEQLYRRLLQVMS